MGHQYNLATATPFSTSADPGISCKAGKIIWERAEIGKSRQSGTFLSFLFSLLFPPMGLEPTSLETLLKVFQARGSKKLNQNSKKMNSGFNFIIWSKAQLPVFQKPDQFYYLPNDQCWLHFHFLLQIFCQ